VNATGLTPTVFRMATSTGGRARRRAVALVLVPVPGGARGVARSLGDVRSDLDAALEHAARRKERLGRLLKLVRAAPHHDDFEAPFGIEVNVHRGPHLLAQLVLHVGNALGELAHVVVVNDGDARERLYAFRTRASG